jgi:two-component sensor histidine kinase
MTAQVLFSNISFGKTLSLPDTLLEKVQQLPEEQRDSFLLDAAWHYYSMYTREGYLLALECDLTAYHIALRLGHEDQVNRAYKGMAAVHDASNNAQEAIKYYQLYYDGIKNKHNPKLNFFAAYNLAATYTKSRDKKALEYIPLMERAMAASKDSSLIYIGDLFIAGIYGKFKNYAKLIYYFDKLPDSINFEDHNYAYGRMYAEVKCRYLIETGHPKNALDLLKKELAITKDSIPALLSLINFSAETGNYKQAHEYHAVLDDYNVRKTDKEIQSRIDYKLLSAENERNEVNNRKLKLREKELKHTNLALYFVAGLLVLLLIIMVFLFYKFRKQNKKVLQQNDYIQSQNEHIALLLKEIHHRVKNNLQIISSLIELELVNPSGDPIDSLLKIQSKMQSFALAHQMMYESSDLDRVQLQPYFEQMIQATLSILVAPGTFIEQRVDMGNASLEPNRLVLLALLVNELITNTCKHVLPFEKNCYISFTCIVKDNKLYINYTDSGGPITQKKAASGTGRRLIPKLAAQMQAETEIKEEAGKLEFIFIMPEQEI